MAEDDAQALAIVGMACRFPGAPDVDRFWELLARGASAVRRFSLAELEAAGVDPALARDPAYVPARAALDDVAGFDAAFFGMSPREAEVTDPQHRLLLEVAWEALERAGHAGPRGDRVVSVFAGAAASGYLQRHLLAGGPLDPLREDEARLGNEPDNLATRIAYKLDLRGASLTVQTACSTSLVAVQLACQALLSYQCDLALAGGVSIGFPAGAGYYATPGGIGAPDGVCRAFDADARGAVPGDGAGLVVLKRLADARADGDHIHALILAAATNNDGAEKAGYTAPGVAGQAEVVAAALELAGVGARSIGYVEAHGTGTRVGDPIEVAALTQAFRESTEDRGYCALGSVKTNIGHLNTAAGVAGLIKAALALEHREIPASLHFTRENPDLGLHASPFVIAAEKRPFPAIEGTRRAGVSSFGFGGTNAHVVLEEAPAPPASSPGRAFEIVTLSARSEAALAEASRQLAEALERRDAELADVAFTLHVGRRAFTHRRAVAAADRAAAIAALRAPEAATIAAREPAIAFLFPGQGAQHPRMAAGLYAGEPVFREELDRCLAALAPEMARGLDLRALIFGDDAAALRRTEIAQPAIFAVEVALARTLLALGARPTALLGHSLGEYSAACVASAFSLADAAAIVAERGRLMEALPEGAMLALALPEEDARAEIAIEIGSDLSIAAINGPRSTVVSGSVAAVEALAARLAARDVACRRLASTRAFHAPAVAPILDRLRASIAAARREPPRLRLVSNLHGAFMTPAQAVDPAGWARHTREPVRFAEGLRALAEGGAPLLLEVGPGHALASAARQTLGVETTPCLREAEGDRDERAFAAAIGRLWAHGAAIDWKRYHAREQRRRLPLPTYPFERRRCWIDPPALTRPRAHAATEPTGDERFLIEAEARLRREIAPRSLDDWPGARPLLDELSSAFVVRTLRDAGVDVRAGSSHELAAVRAALGVIPALGRLFEEMIRGLAADGVVTIDGPRLAFARDGLRDPALVAGEARARFPELRGLVDLLEHAFASYRDALCGRAPAISVLYPDGSSALADQAEKNTAEHRDQRVYLRLAIEAVLRLAAEPRDRPLRILEVGGGRGALTWLLVEALAARGLRVDYCFTDLGRTFLEDARAEAARRGASFMRFARLDIGEPAGAQGLGEASFDLVLALDVVHATRDARRTLQNLRALLAARGALLMLEAQSIDRWEVLAWGLAEGFWYFDDDLRDRSPLLPVEAWERALAEVGFEGVVALPRDPEARARRGHALLFARRGAIEAAPAVVERVEIASSPRAASPPRTDLERRLIALVEAVLGVSGVGVDDDFFALGADSLVMLRLTDRVRRELGLAVPPEAAFRGATVAKLARAIERRAEPSPASSIVPLQPRGTRAPLFFLHPAVGVVFPYIDLARRLGDDQPSYAFQAAGIDGEGEIDRSIEAMSARYLADLRAFQPRGPYHLAGFSFGGLLAYDLALRLRRAGEEVGLVAILDEPAPVLGFRPDPIELPRLVMSGMLKSIWPHLHDYFYLRSAQQRPTTSPLPLPDLEPILRRDGALRAFLARSAMAHFVPPESRLLALRQPAIVPMFQHFALHVQLSERYVPEAYPGKLTVFKASEIGALGKGDPTMGWRVLAAGGVDAHRVPGEHLTLLRPPHVEALADELRAALRAAQG